MLSSAFILTALVVILALSFDFINGFHDTANAIATSVSTRAMTAGEAIIMSAILNFVGALVSTKVAHTVGADIVNPASIPQTVVVAALISAIIWNLVTWYFGIPSSSSHALIGGLIGSAIVYKMSFAIVHWEKFLVKVVLWLFLSPVIGFFVGYLIMVALNWIFRGAKPQFVNRFFLKAQILSSAAMAFNHGSNDAQKSMGIIAMALAVYTQGPFHVPTWVKVSCAIAMALGTSVGGWKIIKTMGTGMSSKLTPVNGFAAQIGSSAVIFTATMLHAPVSTTHIASGTIMGVGASRRLSSVRWGLAQNIIWTWVITIPTSAAVAGLVISVIKLFT